MLGRLEIIILLVVWIGQVASVAPLEEAIAGDPRPTLSTPLTLRDASQSVVEGAGRTRGV
jgi:hypothetical protein